MTTQVAGALVAGNAGRRLPRRTALRLLGAGALGLTGAVFLGCDGGTADSIARGAGASGASTSPQGQASMFLEPAPAPAADVAAEAQRWPLPALPAGRLEGALLPDTPWETPVVAAHAGIDGPRVLVLGGVHGNEPGGWMAAESIATWTPRAGSLWVVPRANRLATGAFQRTLPELGDLNRLYPGAEDGPPMARMAATITGLVREYQIDLVLDLHESWGFYLERGTNGGTAFIGQTVAKGTGPLPNEFVIGAIEAVNARITERERLTFRERIGPPPSADGSPGPTSTAVPGVPALPGQPSGRSTSSLSIGQHVPGATAILIEMGQMSQPERRRQELHELLVAELLTRHGVL